MPKPSDASNSAAEPQQRRSPYFLQRLGNFDLLNNLLLNREWVYQSLKRLSPIRTCSPKEEVARRTKLKTNHVVRSIEDQKAGKIPNKHDTFVSYLENTDMTVSKPRGMPPKKRSAKDKPNRRLRIATTKKRSPPATSKAERAPKIPRIVPKASNGKRVNGKGASVADAVVISDSEDDGPNLARQFATDSLTPPRQTLKIDLPGSEDDLKPVPMPTPTPTPTRSNNLENELVRMQVAHARVVECLRLQLSASEAKVKQIKEDAAREAAELQRRHSVSSDKHMADLDEQLQIERRRTSDLTWECDHLRQEMEEARSCLKGEVDLIQQRDDYERLFNEEKETNANLMRGLEEKDRGAARKAEETESEIRELAKQIEDLQREVTDLMNKNTALRMDTSSQYTEDASSSSSPAPSLSSSQSTSVSGNELRLANVRKTYITVKRRYDNLHSVASNISTATRSWDYGSFGEFGTYLRQLKMALVENGPEEQGLVLSSQAVKID